MASNDMRVKVGDRVRIKPEHADGYVQPFRRLVQARRAATVLSVSDGCVTASIKFDALRKGARSEALGSVFVHWLESVDA